MSILSVIAASLELEHAIRALAQSDDVEGTT
jgi:hypothetical protein